MFAFQNVPNSGARMAFCTRVLKMIVGLGKVVNGCSSRITGILQPCHMGRAIPATALKKKIKTLYEKYYSLEDVFLDCPCIISESGLKNCLNFLKMSEQ